MKIPNKEDLKKYVISAQKGLQEIPQEINDLKEDLHKASTKVKKGLHEISTDLGTAASWLADKAEYCKATDVICQKLDITRDVQDFLVVTNAFKPIKQSDYSRRNTHDGVIMPFPKELAEDPFSQVILESLKLREGIYEYICKNPNAKIITSRFSGLKKHLKNLGFDGEFRIADSWEDLFVKLDENWAKHAAYYGNALDPREPRALRITEVNPLPSKLYVVALMQEKLNHVEGNKKRILESYEEEKRIKVLGNVGTYYVKRNSKNLKKANEQVVELDRQINKYSHLLAKAQQAEDVLTDIRNASFEQNAKHFDRVAERHKEREPFEVASKEANMAEEEYNTAYYHNNHEKARAETELNKKNRQTWSKLKEDKEKFEEAQKKALEEFLAIQKKEKQKFAKEQKQQEEAQLKENKETVNKEILEPSETAYQKAKSGYWRKVSKAHAELAKFEDAGKDLM